jgi:predicted transcriptional regulator YdeE/DNA-binding transcriptional MerR regulator
MIKIGDFSKLAHVSIKTLHHYGDLGLLKPAHVDRWNGYRYYTLDQLPRLNRILALKDLSFSLEQVTQLLDEDLSVAEMRGMLRMKQIELAKTLQAEQTRLLSVERRLLQLEREGQPPDHEIAIKEVPAQTILLARAVAASEDAIVPARQSLQELLNQHLLSARLKPTSPWFALLDDLPYAESDLEVAMAVGVQPRVNQRAGDWQGTPVNLTELPAVPSMASVIHEGELAAITNAYTHLYAWTQANGYNVTGSCREIYLPEAGIDSIAPPSQQAGFTEVQCPVQRASIPISILSPEKRKERIMEPKIISKPRFKAVGLSYIGKNEQGEIPQMWGEFNARWNELPMVAGADCYGLCFSSPGGTAAEGEFEYVAAVEVTDDQNIPEGMVYREVPAYKYAVFTHHGKLDKLGETYQYIYNTWLPQSGLELHPNKYDMEVYTDEYKHEEDDSKLYIYVAIL